MSSPTSIDIHEFSTGIQAEKTADGGWVSLGFTGEYINKTVDPIPPAVQEAITNRDFAVAEGASSDEPAFIGREVAGYGSEWSVVAVVTRGRDDRGRSASVYRYFLSEGLGNLGKILSWINVQKQAGQNIIFDPFDTQILGQPHEYSESEPDLPLRPELQSLLESPPPIIIPSDSPCAPLLVNKMAQAIIANGQLIAWGCKVEALEEPRGFQIIQPASSRAEELLRKAIASKPNAPAPVSGEKAIISAINGLVKREKVKPEQVETIESALANSQIDYSYWESIFKGRGTDKALKQGIYSADMVRLLTLRAMVIPETLPEFLAWIDQQIKQQSTQEISDNFQSEIKKSFSQVSGQGTNLSSRVYWGVRLIIPKLIKHPQILNSVVWLLGSPKGIWGYFYSRQVRGEIDKDLSLMHSYVRGKQDLDFKLAEDKEWQKILNKIQVYWRYPSGSEPKYQPLAELFSRLGNYQLSALFYHVCSRFVPKEVFYKLASRGFYLSLYGIRVKREIGPFEYLWLEIVDFGGNIVPNYIFIPVICLSVFLAILGDRLLPNLMANFKSKQQGKNPDITEIDTKKVMKIMKDAVTKKLPENSKKTEIISLLSNDKSNEISLILNCKIFAEENPDCNKIPEEKLIEAISKFKNTKESLEKLIKEIKKDDNNSSHKYDNGKIIEGIKTVLESNLDYAAIKNSSNKIEDITNYQSWIKAIYLYQIKSFRDNPKNHDGIIDFNGETYKKFKVDVEKKLNQTNSTTSAPTGT